MSHRVLIDTAPLVALFSKNDRHHQLCSDALTAIAPPLLTSWPVITEAAWLLRTRPLGLYNLFESVRGGLFALLPLGDHASMQ